MKLALLLAVVASLSYPAWEDRTYRAILQNAGPLVVLQRAPQAEGIGNVYQALSYAPGARLTKLEDGVRTTLCCDQFAEMAGLDIQSFDVAFDASAIVFSGRIDGDAHYALYVLPLDERGRAAAPPRALGTNPQADFVYPVFAPRGRIVFVTTENVEAPSLNDESQRETATQLGSIGIDGARQQLGPNNLSHRVAPTLLSDGRLLFTQWDHLGGTDEGNLFSTALDFSDGRREAGGGAGGQINAYLKAVEVEPGRLVAIGTSRSRTIQSGKLLDVRLGESEEGPLCEPRSHARVVDLTPRIPESGPSFRGVGRFFSAWPLKRLNGTYGRAPLFLVSWADGPVEQGRVTGTSSQPDFGVYLYDSRSGRRLPVLNDPGTWEVSVRPLSPRPAPALGESGPRSASSASDAFLIGSVDILTPLSPASRRSVSRVRLVEGFSDEEGLPRDFGLTEHDGAARLGEANVLPDGSWAALVPANIPIHIQLVDRFGMAVTNEPVWFSGRPGESRVCGGGDLGTTMAGAQPARFDRPRPARRSDVFTRDRVVGVPWDRALQPIFDAKCVRCHEGTPGPANKSLTFTDEDGNVQTMVFDLRGGPSTGGEISVGGEMLSGYSRSHLSLLGPRIAALDRDPGVTVTGDLRPAVEPGAARRSMLFERLNPPQLYGSSRKRLYPGRPVHPVDVGGEELTLDEYALLILMADMGGQFYSRENAPGQSGY